MASPMMSYSIRIKPNQEIIKSLQQFASTNDLHAACIITAVGSVKSATIRMADSKTIKKLAGHFEIVSLVGTFTKDNGGHFHVCLSTEDGSTIGGHVLGDLVVYTTAEIVIGESTSLVYSRQFDEDTGFNELVIQQRH